MDKTQKEVSVTGDVARERMLSRRRILRTGALVAPAIITLQSGAAWAESMSCEEQIIFPLYTDGDQGVLKKLLRDQLGLSGPEANEMVKDFDDPYYNGSEAHNAFLQVEAASCFASIFPA